MSTDSEVVATNTSDLPPDPRLLDLIKFAEVWWISRQHVEPINAIVYPFRDNVRIHPPTMRVTVVLWSQMHRATETRLIEYLALSDLQAKAEISVAIDQMRERVMANIAKVIS